MPKKNKNQIWVHVILLIFCFLSVFPLLRILSISLKEQDQVLSSNFSWFPDTVSWQSYFNVIFQTHFFDWIINSMIITFLTAVIGVSVASTAAYAFSRYKFPMKEGMLVFLMGTQMLPAVMLILPLYFMLKKLNLIDTIPGVIIAYSMTSLPFSVWLLKGYFDTIPRSLEEAAQVDGLSEIGSFWKIIIPLSTPSLAIALLFNVTQAWNEYIVARVILQNSESYTWPLGLFELQGDFDTKWGMFSAASVMVTIPVTIVFLYSSRWLLSGLTLGGVKG